MDRWVEFHEARSGQARRKSVAGVTKCRHSMFSAVSTSIRSLVRLSRACTRTGGTGLGSTLLGWRSLGCSEADVVAGLEVRAVVIDQWIEFAELR